MDKETKIEEVQKQWKGKEAYLLFVIDIIKINQRNAVCSLQYNQAVDMQCI